MAVGGGALFDIIIFLFVDRCEAFDNPPSEGSSTEVVAELAIVVMGKELPWPPRDLETETGVRREVTSVEESLMDEYKAKAALWDFFIFFLVDRDEEFDNPPAKESSTEVAAKVAMVVLEEEPEQPPRDLETETA
jgi:hypothetical protein